MLSAKEIQQIVDPRVIPTPEQQAIIESPLEPTLVVAGAGSGKTETMSMRVLWALANYEELSPGSILGLTFTKKAAGELGERLSQRIGKLAEHVPHVDAAELPTSMTYHAFAQRIVAEHGLRIGVNPDFRMLGEAAAVQMMTDILKGWPRPLDPEMSIETAAEKALKLAGQLAEHEYDVDTARGRLREYSAVLEEIINGSKKSNEGVRGAYRANERRIAFLDPIAKFQERKREMGVLDFSDQLMLATRIVRTCAEAVEAVRAEHRFVLLDEFQDTSVIQMTLLSALFHDHPVTAVGDPNQAIYGWRGASASSLETFLERFAKKADSRRPLTLSTAWRNDEAILTAANRVAQPLRERARNAPSPVLVKSPRAGAGSVEFAYCATTQHAAEAVANYVEGVRAAHRGEKYTVAVLSRKRKHFLPIDRALRERGIPTQLVGYGALLEHPGVSDLRAALEITADVHNSPALMRLLVRADIGPADLKVLSDWARYLASQQGRDKYSAILLEAVDNPPAPGWRRSEAGPAFTHTGARRVALLGARLRTLRNVRTQGLVDLSERAMSVLAIADDAIADPLSRGTRVALDSFIDIVANYERSVENPTLPGFLAWLKLVEEKEHLADPPLDPDPDAVQILTVHAAKGLEWDAVVVFDMADKSFPTHDSKSVAWNEEPPASSGWVNKAEQLPYHLRGDAADLPPFDIDLSDGKTPATAFSNWLKKVYKPALGRYAETEERRVAYVALTRAKHEEFLIGSWFDTAMNERYPSRYLEEARRALNEDSAVASSGDEGAAPGSEVQSAENVMVSKEEAEELRKAQEAHIRDAHFPVPPGPSRKVIALSARRVREALGEMRSRAEVYAVLAEMGESNRVRDVTALLKEQQLRDAENTLVIWKDRISATAVSALIEDAAAYAMDARRPVPSAPQTSANLGSLFHAWAERQLHQASGELWDEPIPGYDTLDDAAKKLFTQMTQNFEQLDIVRTGTPLAIEEPFTLDIAGISVSGRIDAVFRGADGRTVIVDWKSGQMPHKRTSPEKLRYFVTQLRLYRQAWAQDHAEPEGDIQAILAFVAQGKVLSLAQLEDMAGMDAGTPIEELVRDSIAAQAVQE